MAFPTVTLQPAMVHSIVEAFFEVKRGQLKQQLHNSVDQLVDGLLGELLGQVKALLLPKGDGHSSPVSSQPVTTSKDIALQTPSPSPSQSPVRQPSTHQTSKPSTKGRFKFFKSRDKCKAPSLLVTPSSEDTSTKETVSGTSLPSPSLTKEVVNSAAQGIIKVELSYASESFVPLDFGDAFQQPSPSTSESLHFNLKRPSPESPSDVVQLIKQVKPNDANNVPATSREDQQQQVATGTLTSFACTSPSCGKQFPSKFNLQRHVRSHLQIKPYSCKWPGCSYSSPESGKVTRHIRGTHFRRSEKDGQGERTAKWDPKVYIDVNPELLHTNETVSLPEQDENQTKINNHE